jgi:hypothetical protein
VLAGTDHGPCDDPGVGLLNQERLRQLKAAHGATVTIVNSHDPVDYETCRCGRHAVAAS